MFFQDFWTWLDARLATYVSVHAADLAGALTPVAGTLGILYVMFWGWLHLRGQIEEPFMEGVKRILTLFVVLGVALHLWGYHDVLVAVFYQGPTELAAALAGAQHRHEGEPVRAAVGARARAQRVEPAPFREFPEEGAHRLDAVGHRQERADIGFAEHPHQRAPPSQQK